MSHTKYIILLGLVFLTACSTYKQLSPDPKLQSKEQGFLPVTDDDENFVLKGDKKYYIEFPKAEFGNFYLILSSPDKSLLDVYFTDFFDDGKGEMVKAKNENQNIDSLWVYRIGKEKEKYYWVIEKVEKDEMPLILNYRYAPVWRFKFEVKYEEYKNILTKNSTNRTLYNSIDLNYNFGNFSFQNEIRQLDNKRNAIEGMISELDELENIFPDELLNSNDEAYKNYVELKKNVKDELLFNKNFTLVCKVFDALSKRDFEEFFNKTDEMTEILSYPNRFTNGIVERVKFNVANKLSDFSSFVYNKLQNKNDLSAINLSTDVAKIDNLYRLASKNIPADFTAAINYLTKFNIQSEKMGIYFEKEAEMKAAFRNTPTYPNNSFYPKMLQLVKEMKSVIPNDETAKIDKYAGLQITKNMSSAIENARRNAIRLELGFQIAEVLVPRINQARSDERYKDIIKTLNENRELDYLINQYPDIDRLYLDQQKSLAKNSMNKYGFGRAESIIKSLHSDNEFINIKSILGKKQQIVQELEEELFESVKLVSKTAVDSFVSRNKLTITNVGALYQDSSFVPAYNLTFSTKGGADLANKKAQIQEYLDKMKFNELPEGAIKGIYNDFLRNINNRGVEKIRAIVEHGKYYKGNDKTVKSIVNECDINVPKLINKPMDYRELYVTPVTSNTKGENEYMFRILLKIPSDAQFPVFDVNIKLPDEIAKNASGTQWYDKITINNKIIKNEGRVKITAPMPSNNYEAQISPVQMDKDDRNVLEVRFKYPAFKVFKISVMAQKPIIKKN
jgi:hypothetical protein